MRGTWPLEWGCGAGSTEANGWPRQRGAGRRGSARSVGRGVRPTPSPIQPTGLWSRPSQSGGGDPESGEWRVLCHPATGQRLALAESHNNCLLHISHLYLFTLIPSRLHSRLRCLDDGHRTVFEMAHHWFQPTGVDDTINLTQLCPSRMIRGLR